MFFDWFLCLRPFSFRSTLCAILLRFWIRALAVLFSDLNSFFCDCSGEFWCCALPASLVRIGGGSDMADIVLLQEAYSSCVDGTMFLSARAEQQLQELRLVLPYKCPNNFSATFRSNTFQRRFHEMDSMPTASVLMAFTFFTQVATLRGTECFLCFETSVHDYGFFLLFFLSLTLMVDEAFSQSPLFLFCCAFTCILYIHKYAVLKMCARAPLCKVLWVQLMLEKGAI